MAHPSKPIPMPYESIKKDAENSECITTLKKKKKNPKKKEEGVQS